MTRIITLLLSFLFSYSLAFGAESFSYSGRLVNANGSPVTGPVNLGFDLAYSDQLGVLLCSQNLNGVLLSNGVFHVKLEFPDCDLTSILSQTTATKNLLIRVVDKTSTSPVNYSFQAIHSIPISMMSNLSKQLVQMGADPGQVLTWTGDYWAPADPAITSNGTVTSLTATDGLYGGTITESGIIGIQDGGVTANKLNQMGAGAGQVLKWNGNAWEAEDDLDSAEVDPSVRAFARNDVTGITPEICNTNQVLRFISVDSSLRCFDIVKDAIIATEDKLAPSQKAVAAALDLKQDEIQTTTDLKLKTVTLTNADSSWIGLQAPAGSSNFFYTLPGIPGATGQFLKTDGAGNLVWDSPSVGSSNIAAGSINDSHISSISTSKITGLDSQLTSINTSLSTMEDTVRSTDLVGLTPAIGTVTAADTVKTSIEKIVGNVAALQGVQNDYLLKAGGTLSGNLSLGNNSITNLKDPVAAQDAATMKYVDDEITAATYWTKAGVDLSYLAGSVDVGNKLRLRSTTANFLEFKAPDAMGANKTYIFPASDVGASGYALTTDGFGYLTWSPVVTSATSLGGDLSGNIGSAQLIANSVGTNEIADLSITNTKLSLTDGGIPKTKIQNLDSDLASIVSNVTALQNAQGNYLLKTGGTLTGNLSLGNNSITNLKDPVAAQDAATMKYVDDEITAASYWTKAGLDLSYLTGSIDIGNKLRLKSTTASFLEFKAPDAMGLNKTYIFPANDAGSSGYALTTNGSGILAWSPFVTASTTLGGDLSGNIGNAQLVANSVGTNEIADLSVTNAKLSLADGGIPQAKVQNLETDLSNKEPKIALHASPAGKYWDGNKTWQVLNTTAVPEGTNQYFTDARVQSTVLSNYVVQPSSALSAADSLILALGKLQGQISSNDTELSNLNSKGLWEKNGTKLYYNTGFIGLGTNNPSGALNIVGTGGGDDDLQIDSYGIGEGTVMLRKGQGTAFAPQKVLANDRLGIVTFRGHNGTAFTELAKIQGSATADLDVAASGMLQFYTTNASTNSEKMRITPEGNAGVGTTNPIYHFTVAPQNITVESSSTVVSQAQKDSTIAVQGNGQAYFLGRDVTNDIEFAMGSSSIGHAFSGSTTNHDYRLRTNNQDRLSITTSGNVGVGTNTPEKSLDIVGDIRAHKNESYNVIESRTASETNLSPHFILRRSRGTVQAPTYVQTGDTMGLLTFRNHSASQGASVASFATENQSVGSWGANLAFFTIANGGAVNSERMRIDHTGNVGIGTPTPTAKLDVVGTVKATNFQGTLNGFKMAAGSFTFANGSCGNSVGTACSIVITSGGFTSVPICTITMRNGDATSYTEKMVIRDITISTLNIWRGNYPDAGTTMQGFWTCMGQ